MHGGHITTRRINMRKLRPATPGELLMEEFLKPLGISRYRLAKEIGVPAQPAAAESERYVDTIENMTKYYTVNLNTVRSLPETPPPEQRLAEATQTMPLDNPLCVRRMLVGNQILTKT